MRRLKYPKPERAAKEPPARIARQTRPRKQRRGKRPSLAREADRLWSLIVKKCGRCEDCGRTDFLQAAHGFSRRYRGTRWLPINGFCLCRRCHMRWTHDPLGWTGWLRKRWGLPVYEELERLALTITKPDHKAIVAKLQAEFVSPWDAQARQIVEEEARG